MFRKIFSLATLAIFIALACTSGFAQDLKPKADPGQVQFVSALDAAWVRVLASGEFRNILNDPANAAVPQGTLGVEHNVNMADCLPFPEGTPYPEKPKGLLKQIIKTGEVNRCLVQGAPFPGDTTNFFRYSDAIEEAIFAELADHYGIEDGITRIDVPIDPQLSDTLTDRLNDGTCDYLNQVNALGGETNDLRRRDTRLFTCTLVASGQFIHVPTENRGGGLPDTNHIQNMDDLLDDPSLKVCTGPLSTQFTNRYFENPVDTIYFSFKGDMGECAERVFGEGYCQCLPWIPLPCETSPSENLGGVCPGYAPLTHDDVIMSSLPDLDAPLSAAIMSYPGGPVYPSPHMGKTTGIDTKIVAGTPLWVGIKDTSRDVD